MSYTIYFTELLLFVPRQSLSISIWDLELPTFKLERRLASLKLLRPIHISPSSATPGGISNLKYSGTYVNTFWPRDINFSPSQIALIPSYFSDMYQPIGGSGIFSNWDNLSFNFIIFLPTYKFCANKTFRFLT